MNLSLPVRVFQVLIAAVAVALPAVLIAQYGPTGHAPALIGYSVFCGVTALVIALIGIAAVFFDTIQGLIMLALDAFTTFFLIAGAAAFSAKIGSGSCSVTASNGAYYRKILPTINTSADKQYKNTEAASNDATFRCQMVQADEAMLWILVVCFIASAFLSFRSRSGSGGGPIAYKRSQAQY